MTTPPHDIVAEESVLGAMLIANTAVDSVVEFLTPADFYHPAHQAVYDAIVRLYATGTKIDAVTVVNALDGADVLKGVGGPSALIRWMSDTPSTTAARHYAEIVMDHGLRRRGMGEAQELMHRFADLSIDPADTLELAQVTLAAMGSAIIDHEPDDWAVEDFIERSKEGMSPWVVKNLIRRRHKVMLVGGEGSGKSWILRYVAICVAYGVQPFRHKEQERVNTLIVDLENPEDALFDSFEAILRKVRAFNPQDTTVNRLWWRPQGLNLRNRVDLAEFENVIRARKPDLICLGPLYAAYENSSKDFGWETAAREVQTILKKLMVKYDFALLIEDHAPQGDGAGKRQMRPYGSSFWRRWPDIGIGMEPLSDGCEDQFRLTRWRGDRVPTDWPKIIRRGSAAGSDWPFVGDWGNDDGRS